MAVLQVEPLYECSTGHKRYIPNIIEGILPKEKSMQTNL